MNTKELRIGSFYMVKIHDKWEKHRLDPFSICQAINNEIKIKPIPLTEDWLLDLGFEKWPWCDDSAFIPLFFGDSLYCRYFNGHWFISRMKVGRDSKGVFGKTAFKCILPKGRIKYVHQLQTLFFVLRGKELEPSYG